MTAGTVFAEPMALGGDRDFDLLYLQHAATVRRMGVAILRSPEAADDLVQETFLQLWRHRARYSSEQGSVRTWLLFIARNRAIDMVRSQARDTRRIEAAEGLARVVGDSPDALSVTVSRDEAARLHAAVACLPSAQRQTVVLAYGGGLSHQEVARHTGVPLGTVKSRLRAGHERIAARLEPGRRAQTSAA